MRTIVPNQARVGKLYRGRGWYSGSVAYVKIKPASVNCRVCETPISQKRGPGRIKWFCSGKCRNQTYYTAARTHCVTCKQELDRPGTRRCGTCQRKYNKQDRWLRRFRMYGITPETGKKMLATQGGACGSCGDPITLESCHIDHDQLCCRVIRHETACGKCVRGLLCENCNRGMGQFRDSPERLRMAAEYLESYERYRGMINKPRTGYVRLPQQNLSGYR